MVLKEWDLKYGVVIPNKHSLKVVETGKDYVYTFYNNKGEIVSEFTSKSPRKITVRYEVGKELMKHINIAVENGFIDSNKASSKFQSLLNSLEDYLDNYKLVQEVIDQKLEKEAELKEEKLINDALEWYEGFDEPLIWLGSQIEWLTAGEKRNILKAFFTFCSQIILKHPISLIGLGEGSSGKDHVMSVARSLCPQEYFLDEKQPTLASMFHRGNENINYYDGMIVNYGDLGGDNDQDEVRQTKDLLKEMQTDGFVNRPITLKSGDGFETVDLELHGTPSLVFTTVPNYQSDSQELSRSIVYTPRTDNKGVFFEMVHLLELTGSNVQVSQEKIKNELEEKIPLVIKGLRRMFEDVNVVNPYSRNVECFLGHTEYFKRDFAKYNTILKVIACFNYHNKRISDVNGSRIMFVDKYDLALFFTLFGDDSGSISSNLSPNAVAILKDLMENYDEYIEEDYYDDGLTGFTTASYSEYGEVKLSLRSIQRYFGELTLQGYIKNIGKFGKNTVYSLTSTTPDFISFSTTTFDLDERTVKSLCMAYGEDICTQLQQDPTPLDAGFHNHHHLSIEPLWKENPDVDG